MASRKKKQANRSTSAPLPEAANEAVERLQKLASELDRASAEAEAVADIIQTDLANEMIAHEVDEAARPKKPKKK